MRIVMKRFLTTLPAGLSRAVAAILLLVLALPLAAFAEEATRSPVTPELVPSPPPDSTELKSLYPVRWGDPPVPGTLVPCMDAGHCADCHAANAHMDASHALACIICHGGDSSADDKDRAHQGLIKDPGDLRTVDRTCGKCHPHEVRRVKRSAMALAPRMINHTRFAFGAQATPDSSYTTVKIDGLKQVPHPDESGNLCDDLLRRSCLRCHLYTRGSDRWGEHRGQGCSACHVAYPNSSDGKPRVHALTRHVGMTACLKCHNANHVGADYVGLFEKDFHRGFHSPFVDGGLPPRIYGAEQHRLAADVHFRAGMGCMDCHTLDEVHGNGDIPPAQKPCSAVSCEACHVKGDHPAVRKESNGKMILLRANRRTVPAWDPSKIPHSITEHHSKLRCSACHASWSFQDYGLHLMLEERADYWKWAPTAAQNDPQVQDLLRRFVGTAVEIVPPAKGRLPPEDPERWEPPFTTDWLTGENRKGAWFHGYTARRWERPPLGVDASGRISVMRPIHQYLVSHVDSNENLLIDRMIPTTGAGFPALTWNPYGPHTISERGRACQNCHGSPKAAGLGEAVRGLEKPGIHPVWLPEDRIPGHSFRWDALTDENGTPLQRSSYLKAGPLDPATLRRLLNPSIRHRVLWNRFLKGNSRAGP